jgi:anthranilate synthase component 1
VKLTSFEEFAALAKDATFVPVCREIIADLLTPVSAFLKVAEHADYAFLFESVEGGEHLARYSFLGKDPFLVLRAEGGRTFVDRAGQTVTLDEPPVDALRRLASELRAPAVPGLPRFTGGAVGYLGYEAARWFEPSALASLSAQEEVPDATFMFFDTILAFDHVQHRILIIASAQVAADADLPALYRFACARIGFLERELHRELSRRVVPEPLAHPEPNSNMTRARFEDAVREMQAHIAAGDIYQGVVSQRFETECRADPFRVYRALRYVNPSPYMFYLRMGAVAVAGASPEMLVRVERDHVETHTIAGTRPRRSSEEEDRQMADELQASEKERAEHVMLVDLARNDIGRVSEPGSVRVPQFMGLERYSHVMHMVSVVEGQLARGLDRLDALVACFPAGTVTGAPRIRAMQIISEVEPSGRGIYAGAIGYLDFAGNLDFCIAIRTLVIRHGRAIAQAGAGIVADSDPGSEYEESRHKAGALLQALELAASGDW